MSGKRKLKNKFIFLIFIFVSSNCEAQAIIWSHLEKGFDVYSPKFSSDGKEIVFVRQRHIPDGHEAESYDEKTLGKIIQKNKTIPRYSDPEVTVSKIGSSKMKKIDWGWTPCFSENGQAIAYAKQVKPISGYRILAKTLAGNSINVFSRKNGMIKELVVPSKYQNLTSPIFLKNGNEILYILSGAVNGAYAGNVGAGKVDLRTRKSEVLLGAAGQFIQSYKDFNYSPYDFSCDGNNCYAASYNGKTLTDVFKGNLAIYHWKNGELNFLPISQDQILIYDNGWKKIKKENGDVVESMGTKEAACKGVISPDGKKIVGLKFDRNSNEEYENGNELLLAEIGNPWMKTLLKTKNKIYDIAWSDDSERIAVVVSHDKSNSEIHDFDELVVMKVDLGKAQ